MTAKTLEIAKTKPVQESLTAFGKAAREATTAEELYRELFAHAHVSTMALNPKASPRGIRVFWSCKLVLKPAKGQDKPRILTQKLSDHYDTLAAAFRKAGALDDDRDGRTVEDSAVAKGLLKRTRNGWLGLPESFSTDPQAAAETTVDDLL